MTRGQDDVDDGGPAVEFLDWLDARTGAEPTFKMLGDAPPRVTSVCYHDVPHRGSVFASTLGLSLRPYADGWGREVLLRVDDAEPVWAWAVAHLVAELSRQGAAFAVGDTYNFGERIADSSRMNAFVIGEPMGVLNGDTVVHLSSGDHIVLVQAFPLHEEEMLAFRALPDEEREDAVARFLGANRSAIFDVSRAVAALPEA